MILLLLLSYLHFSLASWEGNISVAVVEFVPMTYDFLTATQRVISNAQQQEKLIWPAPDMIIFPEGSLAADSETAAEISISDIPCDTDAYPTYLKILSCAAQNQSTYLVTNFVEKLKCDNKTGYLFYNTDVVFDRKGAIIARYQKFNLFGENDIDEPLVSEVVTFDTDFGLKLGIFAGFDILFKTPALDVLKENVDAVVYTSRWRSELPFLTALQTQQMWSHANDMTFFASGLNNPGESNSGTGIYGGTAMAGQQINIVGSIGPEAPQKYRFDFENGVIRNGATPLDRIITDDGMDEFPLATDDSLKDYEFRFLDFTKLEINETLCSGDDTETRLCCDFSVKIAPFDSWSSNSYTYLMVAYAGTRNYPGYGKMGLEVCGLIACLDSSISSCGQRFPNPQSVLWPLTFEEITISANFENTENKTQFPNSLLSSIRPININETEWSGEEVVLGTKKMVQRRFSIKVPQTKLLTFAIYGRNFGEDVYGDGGNAASSSGIAWVLFISSFLTVVAIR